MQRPRKLLMETRQIILDKTPGSPESTKNTKRIENMTSELAKYFDRLNDTFPYDEMPQKKEGMNDSDITDDIMNLLIPALVTLQPMLNNIIQTNAYRSYIDTSRDFIKTFNTGKSLPIENAIEYASNRSAQMIKNIDETTRKRIQELVKQNLKQNKSIDDLAKAIQSEFNEMSRSRAYKIARTETADALGDASMRQAKDENLEEKTIILGSNPCVICLDNEAEGWMDINDGYSSGDDRAPFHPNCVCTNIYRRKPI